MSINKYLSVLLVIGLFSCNQPSKNKTQSHSLPYVLDMVFNNPGEGKTDSKYIDSGFLKEIGYNGMVPHWYIECGITYDTFEKGILAENSKERNWVLKKQAWIKTKLHEAEKADMPVYAFTDILVLPTVILEKYKNEIVREHKSASGFSAIHGKLVPDINKPLTQKLIRTQIDELFSTFPELDGLVIRFGETYLFDTPFHSGGSPVKSGGEEGIEGHIKLINILKEEICEKRNKKLFYRTWDFGFFHTNPEVFLKITDRIEPHKNLIFSIKYTKGDFHRLLPFNPTVGIGKHQYIVEFQGQPEYYGKGAHPAYVFNGLLNGFEEYNQVMKPEDKQGIKDFLNDPKFAGLWTWSRGGGWQGPYISNELWCDVNARTALNWAKDTTLTEAAALEKTALQIGVKPESINKFIKLVHLSADGCVRGHCSLIDIPEARFNVWWLRDHFFSGLAPLKPFFNYAINNGKVEDVLAEKKESVSIWKEIVELASEIEMENSDNQEFLKVSAEYGRIKYEIIEKAFTVMLLGFQGDKTGSYDKERINEAIAQYDNLWEEWKELKKNNPSCATIYFPDAFSIDSKGVSGNHSNGLGATIDKYRNL
jgi:hypothetical protein